MTLSPTLSMYRRLLVFAGRLPAPKREDSIRRIKEEFRKHSTESDAKRIEDLLKHASSTLGFLKIVTPKYPNEQSGPSRVVFGDSSRPSRAVTNWTGSNMDPDSVSRHYRSLKRAGFTDNKSAKGIF